MNASRLLAAGLLACLPGAAPAFAQSGCEAKLQELDRLIAESDGMTEEQLRPVRMMRDMGAQQCDQGNEAAANPILDLQIRTLRQRHQAKQEELDASIPKEELTPGYLQGDWCTWRATGSDARPDSMRYHFYADGSFHLGPPPTYRLDKSSDPWAHERFLAREYTKLIEKKPDEFRTVEHGRREYVWRRGNC